MIIMMIDLLFGNFLFSIPQSNFVPAVVAAPPNLNFFDRHVRCPISVQSSKRLGESAKIGREMPTADEVILAAKDISKNGDSYPSQPRATFSPIGV